MRQYEKKQIKIFSQIYEDEYFINILEKVVALLVYYKAFIFDVFSIVANEKQTGFEEAIFKAALLVLIYEFFMKIMELLLSFFPKQNQ